MLPISLGFAYTRSISLLSTLHRFHVNAYNKIPQREYNHSDVAESVFRIVAVSVSTVCFCLTAFKYWWSVCCVYKYICVSVFVCVSLSLWLCVYIYIRLFYCKTMRMYLNRQRAFSCLALSLSSFPEYTRTH